MTWRVLPVGRTPKRASERRAAALPSRKYVARTARAVVIASQRHLVDAKAIARPHATPAPAAIAPTPPPKTGSKAATGPTKRSARTASDHIGMRVRKDAKRCVIVSRRLRVVLSLGVYVSARGPGSLCVPGCVGSCTEWRSVLTGGPEVASS